jgi:hypothetical protein
MFIVSIEQEAKNFLSLNSKGLLLRERKASSFEQYYGVRQTNIKVRKPGVERLKPN